MYNETRGKIHFWASMIFNLTFFPMHFVGLAGMLRRYADYPAQFTDFNQVATIGAFGFGLAQVFLFAVALPAYRGGGELEKASDKPGWRGRPRVDGAGSAPFHTFEQPPHVE